MDKPPSHLIYGVDDRPPPGVLILISIQHIFLMSSTLVLPVVLVREVGGGFEEVRSVVALTMIACGIGTILQAMRWRGIGSGFLCPNLCGPNFFGACAQAAWLGGLPLMNGMTAFAGVIESFLALFIHRIAFLFPPEITGLVVLMVAEGLIRIGVSKFFGVNYASESIQPLDLLVAFLTLVVMMGVGVRKTGRLRLYGVLIGLLSGYVFSMLTGLLGEDDWNKLASAGWLALPRHSGMWTYSFQWSLVPTFIIVSLCGALKTYGNLILCEKVNDEDWKQSDPRRIGSGMMADGICVAVSGAIGGMASDTSSSNVALSSATGATSRWIGYVAGLLFIVLGFSPKLSSILSIMPRPVMGAIVVYVTCFMIFSGLSIIMSSKIDQRRTFVVGFSLIFGLSVDLLPELYSKVDPSLRPIFSSSLVFATVLAVLLNQALRLADPAPTDRDPSSSH